jgi:tagaturonate epimerase
VDADHINFETVDRFLEASDFYTIDVADWIGKPASAAQIEAFAARHPEFDRDFIAATAAKYLAAVTEAGRIYRKIEAAKGQGKFIPEVSMDETDSPQTPAELLVILAAIADEKIPIQTIAPKFTGRFNKGVDYQGDVEKFREEFSNDISTIALAVEKYDLPRNLKLSVHSGSDKFSIYRPIREALQKSNAGVHLKTAGTTWLEELIGLAEAGGDGLALAKEIYAHAYEQREALCAPYAAVIDIDPQHLPAPSAVEKWTSDQFVSALRHDQSNPAFNNHLRQLLHVGFKVAAKLGHRYLELLEKFESVVARNVTENLFERHIRPVFIG